MIAVRSTTDRRARPWPTLIRVVLASLVCGALVVALWPSGPRTVEQGLVEQGRVEQGRVEQGTPRPVPTAPPSPPTPTTPPGPIPLTAVQPGHPKLLVDAAGFAELRSRVAADPTLQTWVAVLKGRADGLLTAPAAPRPTTGELLSVSGTILDRSYTLGLLWQLTGDPRYADRLWVELDAASHYADWNPQHFLDTAQLAHAFAIGYDWGYDHWTAAQRQQLAAAVSAKAFEPGLLNLRANGYWSELTTNWNLICNSGLGLAALAFSAELPTQSGELLARIPGSLTHGLSAYAPAGAYPEGLSYWSWATGYLVTFLAALRSAAGSDDGLAASPGLATTGRFALGATGASGRLFAFGDAYDDQPVSTVLLGLSRVFDDPALVPRALRSLHRDRADEISARTVLWYAPLSRDAEAAVAALPLDGTWPGAAGVTSLRSSWTDPDATSVTLRAADTDSASHANLDAGDFTLDALGVQWATETGATDLYDLPGMLDSAADGRRWSYYRNRPEGQNTLVVDPSAAVGARTRPRASAALVRSGPDSAAAVADLVRAYPGAGWRRGVALVEGRADVVVQDEVVDPSARPTWWFLHTDAAIALATDGRSATLSQQGRRLLVRITSSTATDGGARFQVRPRAPLSGSPDPSVQTVPAGQRVASGQKLAIDLGRSRARTLAVQFTPLREGTATDAPAPVRPLASWGNRTPAAVLTGLGVDGRPLQHFEPGVPGYTVSASSEDAPPTVSATAATGTEVEIRQAVGVPGVALVTARRAGAAPTTYRIAFDTGPPPVSALSTTTDPEHADDLVDGDVEDGWQFAGEQAATLQYTRPLGFTVLQTYWTALPPGGVATQVWGSEDGRTWTSLAVGRTSQTMAWQSTTLPPGGHYRYLRVVGSGLGVSRLAELRAMASNRPLLAGDAAP